MNNPGFIYPAAPPGVDEKVIQPSAAFKQEVFKVMLAILFFILIYLLLIAVACGLAILCAYGGIALMTAFPRFITLMIGIGLIIMGLMIVYFLLKFFFKSNKVDRSNLIEIKKDNQPDLFEFIRRITKETRTPFPKKIYLTQEVNACVFYDSSFWSMFLPVKKNLMIGLGLVNSVSLSEFKAVLAHEFGHFSQRSMKLGSYTYNVNKVIYDMLYDNENYGNVLESWGSKSQYFALFAGITIKIVGGIQWILRGVYSIVNKSYLSLSRQMEFHADSVAAYVSGSLPLITSLRRLEATDMCYNTLFNHYNSWISDNYKPDNIYKHHTEVMKHFADSYKVPFEHGLLQINKNSISLFNRSRIVIKDQWASHPSTEEREKHLLELNVPSEMVYESAWLLFHDPAALQKQMTEKVYENVKFEKAPEMLDTIAFNKKYADTVKENSFDRAYKGFYDTRSVPPFNLSETLAESESGKAGSFEDLFSDLNCGLPAAIQSLEQDIQILKTIEQGNTGIKTFDFDGKKFNRADAPRVRTDLETELKEKQKDLEKLEKQIFLFFYDRAKAKGNEQQLVAGYEKLFWSAREAEADLALYNEMVETVQLVYKRMSFPEIRNTVHKIETREVPLKKRMAELLKEESSEKILNSDQRKVWDEYLSRSLVYFIEPNYYQSSLDTLNESLRIFLFVLTERNFKIKKTHLDRQLEFLN